MSTATSRPAPQHDVVLRLDAPEELFAVDAGRLLTGPGRLVTGIDELVDRFLSQKKVRPGQRVVLNLPASDDVTHLASTLEASIRRYCRLRIEDLRRQQSVMWREGRHSLVVGLLLFFVGVVLSYGFTRPDTPDFWRQLLGDGIFLVVAWIGLWYPLDLLFIARQPLKREIDVLTRIVELPVAVRLRSPQPSAGIRPDALPPAVDTDASPPPGH